MLPILIQFFGTSAGTIAAAVGLDIAWSVCDRYQVGEEVWPK